MRYLSTGKLRRLQQLANHNGILTVCAMDHRASLQQAMHSKKTDTISYQDMVDFKLDLCKTRSAFCQRGAS